MPVAQPPRTQGWRFTPSEASGNERPATCPWRSHRSHRGQIAGVSFRMKRVATSAPRLARRRRTKKPPACTGGFLCWRKPIFPDRLQSSIFGAGELNFRVRDGNGWTLAAINTNYSVCCLTGQLQYNTTAFWELQAFFQNFPKKFRGQSGGPGKAAVPDSFEPSERD